MKKEKVKKNFTYADIIMIIIIGIATIYTIHTLSEPQVIEIKVEYPNHTEIIKQINNDKEKL